MIPPNSPIWLGGRLQYTSHPADRTLATGKTAPPAATPYKIRYRDLARLQQISCHIKKRLVRFDPHLALIFARGGIPINFSLIRRLEKVGHRKYLDGKTFHLLPGLKHVWRGLGIDGTAYFKAELTQMLKDCPSRPVKILVADGTRTGRTLRHTVKVISQVANTANIEVHLSIHAILDEAGNLKKPRTGWPVRGSGGRALHVVPLAKTVKPPILPFSMGALSLVSHHFYPVGNLFYEDFSDFLGAKISGGFLEPLRRQGLVLYAQDDGNVCGGSSSLDELSKNFIAHLAEVGPRQIQRAWNLECAQRKGADFLTRIGMCWADVIKRISF